MSIEQEIQDLTQSTTDLLNAVNTKKATLDSAVDTAEAAKTVATSKAAEATTVVADASTHATNASNSATQAAASAASANAIVTGVATGLPTVRPSLNLDFVNSGVVDPRIDFTRSTTATYYDGKTTAKAEENLFYDSTTNLTNTAGTNVIRTFENIITPDGNVHQAVHIVPTTDTSHNGGYWGGIAIIPATTHTISCYVKPDGYTDFLFGDAASSQVTVTWDLTGSGSVTYTGGSKYVSSGVQQVSSEWYRVWVTVSTNGIAYSMSPIPTGGAAGQYGSYTGAGDGVSGAYLAWPQIEVRDSVTAFTPTTGSPITNYVPVLKTAAINEPRLDHDPVTGECKGLLMEGSSTNFCAYSEDISTGAPYNSVVTVATNLAIAPNGTLTADKVIPTGNGARRGDHFTLIGSMVEGDTYTLSGFYKADGSHYTRVKLGGVFGGEDAIFDFDTGEFVSQAANVTNTKAENVGNGWWRLSVTYVFQNQIGNNYPYALIAQPLLSNNSSTAPSYTGYNGVYVWGVQYEQADFPSSYIPTSGASVTRAQDDMKMDLSYLNIGNEFSYVMSASKQKATGSWSRYFTLRDTSNGNSTIAALNPSGHLYFETKHQTQNTGSFYRQYDFVDGQEVTIGGSLINDQLIYDTSGSSVYTDSTGRSPVAVSLLFLDRSQHTKYFKLYNHAIAASELEALTQE